MSETQHKTVFISYRRNVSSFIARAIFLDLRAHGYDVFMDVESIDSGTFDTIILNQIAARPHFLVILTPGTLERCEEPNDMLRREVERAMDVQRNIVPLLVNDFKFENVEQYLTGKLHRLPRFNGLTLPHEYFDAAMEKLRSRFLKQPSIGLVEYVPASEQLKIEEKIAGVAAKTAPTKAEISAEQHFHRALNRPKDDFVAQIEDYSEAIRLNPSFAEAFGNRGIARSERGDLVGAIRDFERVMRLNLRDARAFYNRGLARAKSKNIDGAIQDFTHTIRLDDKHANAYFSRGVLRLKKGDVQGALDDYNSAIIFDPKHASAFNSRGVIRTHLALLKLAIEDFDHAIQLQPENTTAYSNRGRAHSQMGNLLQAIEDYQTYLELGGGIRYGNQEKVEGWIRELKAKLNQPD